MLFALSTESQVALGVMAGIFIVFSLLSSFVFPARNPDFPGKKWRNAYIVLCTALFVLMMATVVIWGKEEEEAEAGGEHPGQTVPGEEGEALPPEFAGGDAAAGKIVFTDNGCGACHVLSAAGAVGVVGPNLDETKPSEALIADRVVNGKGAMQSFREQLSDEQIADVVAFVHESTAES